MKKGVSLYLAVLLMTMLLAMVLGISAILLRQLQTIKGLEDSVTALYAADSGMEQALADVIANRTDPQPGYADTLSNGARYDVEVECCQECGGFNPPVCKCAWNSAASNPCPLPSDADCPGYFYCIKSRGYYGPPGNRTKTQRAIQVAL